MSKIVTASAVVVEVAGDNVYLHHGDTIPQGALAADVEHLLSIGLVKDSGEPEAQEAQAEGEPSDKWTVKQLTAYAESKLIDLQGATKKADVLAAIKVGKPITVVEGQAPVVVTEQESGDREPGTPDATDTTTTDAGTTGVTE